MTPQPLPAPTSSTGQVFRQKSNPVQKYLLTRHPGIWNISCDISLDSAPGTRSDTRALAVKHPETWPTFDLRQILTSYGPCLCPTPLHLLHRASVEVAEQEGWRSACAGSWETEPREATQQTIARSALSMETGQQLCLRR